MRKSQWLILEYFCTYYTMVKKLFIHSVLFEIILCAIKYYRNIVFTNDIAFIKIHITCIHIYISTLNKEHIAMCFFFAQNLKRDGSCKYFLPIVHVTCYEDSTETSRCSLLAYALIPLKSRRESLPTVRVITPVAVTLIYRILLG